MPGSSGTLCLGSPIGRFTAPGQIQSSQGSGYLSIEVDLTALPTPRGSVVVQPGETWFFQTWYRDNLAGMPTSNFTAGLEIAFD